MKLRFRERVSKGRGGNLEAKEEKRKKGHHRISPNNRKREEKETP
jgi:hypothetical protein